MSSHWPVRAIPAELVERYQREGWWTEETLGTLVASGLAAMPDAAFVIHSKTRPWRGTMAEVEAQAKVFAGWLRARGVGEGDVVVCQLPNWVEAAITFWGAAYAGAVIVPVVHFYGAKELAHILRVAAPAVVVTASAFGRADYLEAYAHLLAGGDAAWLVVGDTEADDLPAGAAPFGSTMDAEPLDAPVAVDPAAIAVVGFTSGTTQDPKGVLHTNRTMVFEAKQLGSLSPLGAPPSLVGAPVGHFIGMLAAFTTSLIRRSAVHLIDVWDPAEVIRLMRAEGLGVAGAAPFFLTSLLDHPDWDDALVAGFPTLGLGGSSVPAAVTERATRLGITVFRSYGSTEHPSITASSVEAPIEKRLRTDGLPLQGVEVRLDAENQIYSRGPELCAGYTDLTLTAKAFDADGWYATGDVGIFDADGYLAITDRISDIIIRGGENISALEVEEALLGLDAIAEVGVVARPDDRLGEHVAAVVRAKPGRAVPPLAEIQDHLRALGLAKQKWPQSLYSIEDFPRTPSGKIQKFLLRQRVRDGELTATW